MRTTGDRTGPQISRRGFLRRLRGSGRGGGGRPDRLRRVIGRQRVVLVVEEHAHCRGERDAGRGDGDQPGRRPRVQAGPSGGHAELHGDQRHRLERLLLQDPDPDRQREPAGPDYGRDRGPAAVRRQGPGPAAEQLRDVGQGEPAGVLLRRPPGADRVDDVPGRPVRAADRLQRREHVLLHRAAGQGGRQLSGGQLDAGRLPHHGREVGRRLRLGGVGLGRAAVGELDLLDVRQQRQPAHRGALARRQLDVGHLLQERPGGAGPPGRLALGSADRQRRQHGRGPAVHDRPEERQAVGIAGRRRRRDAAGPVRQQPHRHDDRRRVLGRRAAHRGHVADVVRRAVLPGLVDAEAPAGRRRATRCSSPPRTRSWPGSS